MPPVTPELVGKVVGQLAERCEFIAVEVRVCDRNGVAIRSRDAQQLQELRRRTIRIVHV
jgi:hypothetical protein